MSLDFNEGRRITPRDTVSRALEHYVHEMIDPAEFHHDSNWWAYSRGVKLDTKSRHRGLGSQGRHLAGNARDHCRLTAVEHATAWRRAVTLRVPGPAFGPGLAFLAEHSHDPFTHPL